MPNDNLNNYLKLHLIVFIWGFTGILGALITLDSTPLVWFRMLFAVFFIFIYIKFKNIPLKITPKVFLSFIICGLIIALHWVTFFKAIKVSNVSIALSCLSAGAFFTSLLEPILFGKKIIWYEVFFGLIVILGLYIIFQVKGNYQQGIFLGVASAFLSALFAVINGKFVKKHNPTLISFYELSGGVLFLSIFLLFSNSFSVSFFQLSLKDFFYLLILSSVCTAYAFIASTAIMKHLSSFTVMLTINLEPIYGIILAVLIFKDKEKMSLQFYIGAAIILLSVILNAIIKSKSKQISE